MYRLEIVTPEGIVYSGDVYQTVVNTADGEMGILENHMLVLTNVIPGKIRIEKEGEEPVEYASTYGVIEIAGDKVIILAEEIYEVDKIDAEKETKLLEEATAKLESEELSEDEKFRYERQKFRAEALLRILEESKLKV